MQDPFATPPGKRSPARRLRGRLPAPVTIWTAGEGPRLVKDLLVEDYGLDLSGWELHYAAGISDDGRTIVGAGVNPEGQAEGWIPVDIHRS